MKTWRAVSGVAAACFLAACGGGGGGGGDDKIRYTGKTTQALITYANANVVAEGLALGVPVMLEDSASSRPLLRTAPAEGPTPRRSAAAVGRLVDRALRAALSRRAQGSVERRLDRTESGSDPGSCGGTLRFELVIDDASGELSGSMTFSSDYCDEGVMTSGEVSVGGAFDPLDGEIAWMEIQTDLMTIQDLEHTYDISMSGTLRFTSDAVALNAALRDNEAEEVFLFEGFRFAEVDGPGDQTLTVGGRYYDPGEGYVDFVTVSPLVFYEADEGPRAGEVKALGRDGTTSRLTALSAETYRVDADLNGDGDYGDPGVDYGSGELNWADF